MSLDDLRRIRRERREDVRTWGAGHGGRMGTPSPMFGQRSGGQPQPSMTIEAPYGEMVRLQTGTQPAGVVAWQSRTADSTQTEWPGLELGPEILIPTLAYYSAHLEADLPEPGSGTVWLLVDGVRVQPCSGWGSRVEHEWKTGVLVPGQTVGVETSTGVTGARLSVHLVEKPRRTVRADVEPWAWFQPDGMSGYSQGDPVTLWSDTTSNQRDLVTTVGDEPSYVASALNSLPGVDFSGASLNDARLLRADVSPEPVDRVTFLMVVADTAAAYNAETSLVTLGGPVESGLYLYREASGYDLVVSAAEDSAYFWAGDYGSPLNRAGGIMLEASRTPDGVALSVDGTQTAADSSGFGTPPPAGPSSIDRLIVGDTGPVQLTVCELVVLVGDEQHELLPSLRADLSSRWGL
jgi:hypothetical protein